MALTKKRSVKIVRAKSLDMLAAAATYYQGGLACLDTADGLVKKGAASTTLRPIGLFAQDKVVAGGGSISVNLFREIEAVWFKNSGADAVDVADVGKDCFIVDDDTVRETSNSGACSVAGLVWKVDATKGVLVEPYASPVLSPGADAIAALTDNTTGVANDTLEAIPDPADAPATADALRDDLVANTLPAIRNDLADLAAKVNAILAAM